MSPRSPSASDPVTGLVASRIFDVAEVGALAGISSEDLDPLLVAVSRARAFAGVEDWAAVANLEAELGRIAPGEALFAEASRLRIRWRLARQEPTSAAEAQSIAEILLVRRWLPDDALLRAGAASLAKRPQDAWGSLSRVITMLNGHPQRARLLRAVRRIVKTLPGELDIAFEYDVAGDLHSMTFPDQPAHTFTYDLYGKIASITPPAVAGSGSRHGAESSATTPMPWQFCWPRTALP